MKSNRSRDNAFPCGRCLPHTPVSIREKVSIIENADNPKIANFIIGEGGKRLLFKGHGEAEEWLNKNGKPGVDCRAFDGMD